MGDRTPETVIARFIAELRGYGAPFPAHVEQAHELLAALAAAGFAVVPQADVDAATRLREAIDYHRGYHFGDRGEPDGCCKADARLWAAAAVGTVDPEEEPVPVVVDPEMMQPDLRSLPFFPSRANRGTGQSPAATPATPMSTEDALRHLIPARPDFYAWLAQGQAAGYASATFCENHGMSEDANPDDDRCLYAVTLPGWRDGDT